MRRQLAVVSILTALSQLAAFFKLWFTARIFGVGSELDGYNLALVVPSLISGVMAGLLQTGFFPVRARLHAQGDAAVTEAFERAVLWGSGLIGIVLTLGVAVALPWLTHFMVPPNQPAVREAFSFSLPFAAPLVALNMTIDCSGYILAMRGKFAYAAGAPVLNGLLGGLVLALWPSGGLLSLVSSTVIGVMAQLAVCGFALRKSKFSIWGAFPGWSKAVPQGRQMISLAGWILPGVIFSNMVVSLPPVWAASFGEGAVSAFGYAYRLHASLVQLMVMASATLILARFSELIAEGDKASIHRLLRQATMLSFGVGLGSVVFVWVFGQSMLLWLFGGRFDVLAASRVTDLWVWLTVGLGFTLLGNVFAKLWQAQARPKLISLMAAFSLIALYTCFYSFRTLMNEQAIPLALSVAPVAVVLLGYKFLDFSFRPSRNSI